MPISFLMSDDGRILTDAYPKKGGTRFCLAEKTSEGTLITEFNEHSEVVDQVYTKSADHERNLAEYLGIRERNVVLTGSYKGVKIRAKCTKCSSVDIRRILDLCAPFEIKEIPVVPMYACQSCNSRYYSLTDDYLKVLVERKTELFEKDELDALHKDAGGSVRLLQEYIIRIFASKKISRISVE